MEVNEIIKKCDALISVIESIKWCGIDAIRLKVKQLESEFSDLCDLTEHRTVIDDELDGDVSYAINLNRRK